MKLQTLVDDLEEKLSEHDYVRHTSRGSASVTQFYAPGTSQDYIEVRKGPFESIEIEIHIHHNHAAWADGLRVLSELIGVNQ